MSQRVPQNSSTLTYAYGPEGMSLPSPRYDNRSQSTTPMCWGPSQISTTLSRFPCCPEGMPLPSARYDNRPRSTPTMSRERPQRSPTSRYDYSTEIMAMSSPRYNDHLPSTTTRSREPLQRSSRSRYDYSSEVVPTASPQYDDRSQSIAKLVRARSPTKSARAETAPPMPNTEYRRTKARQEPRPNWPEEPKDPRNFWPCPELCGAYMYLDEKRCNTTGCPGKRPESVTEKKV